MSAEGALIFFALGDFGGKVQESTSKLVHLLPRRETGAQAKVKELDVSPGIQYDILWLQPMCCTLLPSHGSSAQHTQSA